tara:strand:+ start:727 stop:1818 length:1092 start_codon:yes stop_codon:yes gene_type:complete
MNYKLSELFDIKYISNKNIENRDIINNLEVHNILNINENIRKQFILIISTYHKNIQVINIFKKMLKRDNTWSTKQVQYLNSFCISGDCGNQYNWRNLEEEKNIEEKYFLIDESYERSILSDDYDFFIELKSNFKPLTIELYKTLESKKWGKTYHLDNISWQVILGNIITTFYGTGVDHVYYRCNNFIEGSGKVYYNNYDETSIIYNKFIKSRIVCCDACHETMKININKFYNYSKYGDMCELCFKEKKKREVFRIKYFKKLLLNVGKIELFKKNVENTRLFLSKNKIKELSYYKKYNIMKKFNENMFINITKKNECTICLEEMSNDIYAGSCGHCFHEHCYFKLQSNRCPLCRKTGYFKKLHL